MGSFNRFSSFRSFRNCFNESRRSCVSTHAFLRQTSARMYWRSLGQCLEIFESIGVRIWQFFAWTYRSRIDSTLKLNSRIGSAWIYELRTFLTSIQKLQTRFTIFVRFSVVDEDCYPYEASVGRCRAKKNDNLRTMQCNVPDDRHDGLYKMGPAYSLNNETDIRFEIFHYGPVQGEQKFTFDWHNS